MKLRFTDLIKFGVRFNYTHFCDISKLIGFEKVKNHLCCGKMFSKKDLTRHERTKKHERLSLVITFEE